MATLSTVTNVVSIGQQKSGDIELSEFIKSVPVGYRGQRFEAIGNAMLRAGRPICILETGCMRPTKIDPPECDGCSTLVWDYIAKRTEGCCVTVDIDPENVAFAQSKVGQCTQVFCADSLRFLANVKMTRPIDFLYLDSMDWQGTAEEKGVSALHHAAELAIIWPQLNHGALIAVDDCVGEYEGKHALVKRFFDSIGAECLSQDWIHVWRKPVPNVLNFVPSN